MQSINENIAPNGKYVNFYLSNGVQTCNCFLFNHKIRDLWELLLWICKFPINLLIYSSNQSIFTDRVTKKNLGICSYLTP